MRKSFRGSYTVEASLLMPVILFAIFQGMKLGTHLCMEVREGSAYWEELKDLNGAEIFKTTQGVDELWEELHGDGI